MAPACQAMTAPRKQTGMQHSETQAGVGAENSPVARIVYPATALLHPDATPLRLEQQAALWQALCKLLRQDDVTVHTEEVLESRYTREDATSSYQVRQCTLRGAELRQL